ncbi:MAG: formate/nitrite transporter family protein [Clostridia bacterium]|nr:formate/nitrite transporter family protein [Clostridia bacterium]
MKILKTFIGAILAGVSIGLGGAVFLATDSKVIGAAMFTIGLFTVCTMGFNLFTGKICYVFENDAKYARTLPLIWLGNLAGTGLVALAVSATRYAEAFSEKAKAMIEIKTNDSLVSLFFLGVLCNIFIFIAVDGFKNNPHEIGKYLSLIFGVMVFILAGTEHCVADMFYFWVGGFTGKGIICLLVITLGNSVGGAAFALCRKILRPEEKVK